MPNIDVKYDLSMAPGPGKTRIYFSQGDRGLATATLSLFANNYPLYLEDEITAMIVGRKPDKTAYAYDCQISKDRRAVIVTAAEQMTAVAGTGEAQIIFTDGDGNVAGTCNFEVVVEADPTEGTTPSESDYAVFYQAIAAAGEALASAQLAEQHAENAETSAEEAAGSATTATEAATAAEAAQAAIEADRPVIVSLSVTAAAVVTAITQSQETGEPVTLAAQYITADPEDAEIIWAALYAKKRVRFDLAVSIGTGSTVRTSAARFRTAPGGRDITHYYVTFDNADLCGYFTGLDTLKIGYTYNADGRNSVEVVVKAVKEDFNLIFTAPISDPIVTQTAIPATVNHTAEEVAAAYAAGRKVNAKIHFTSESPITFDLDPVYTVAMELDDGTEHMYSGLLVTGTDRIDAYQVMAMWDNGDPVVMIPGKVADYSEAVADLETDVADLDGRVDALEEAEEARVEISVSRANVTSALTDAKNNTGANNTASIPSSGITVSLDDLRNAKSALVSGKRVRFDLKMMNGTNVYAVVSTYTAIPGGNNMGLFFNCEGLTAFNGLQSIIFTYTNTGSSESVSITLYANPKTDYYIRFTCTAAEFEQAYNYENTVMIGCSRTFSAINTAVQYANTNNNTIVARLFVTDSNKVVKVYELPICEVAAGIVNFLSAVEATTQAEESGVFSIPRIFACRIAVSQEGTQLMVATGDLSI